MKRIYLVIVCIIFLGCASSGRYNTQKGAAVGAALGAITGQIIGKDTKSTVIGTGIGTLGGAILGNFEDQKNTEIREKKDKHDTIIYTSPNAQVLTQPPGTWKQVSGHWKGNIWVPVHQEWIPIQP